MINKQEFEQLKADEGLKVATSNLMKFFADFELTPSLDLEKIKQEYRINLFHRLLKIDKAYKMRYEMHRTEGAKLKMINDTVSLEGYQEIDEISEAINLYHYAFPVVTLRACGLTPEICVEKYGGDVVQAAEQYVVDTSLEGDPLFAQLKQIEGIVNEWLEKGYFPNTEYKRPWDILRHELMPVNHRTNKVGIDEVRTYHYLQQFKSTTNTTNPEG